MNSIVFDPDIFPIVCGAVGLCVGSFLNVVIHRLPLMLELRWKQEAAELHGIPAETTAKPTITLARPRSRCPHCGHLITALENIPLLSYFFLRGRCSQCKTPISLRYPIIELVTMVFSTLVAIRFGATPQAGAALIFVWAAIALACIDFDTFLLPDDITLPLLWIGLLFNLWSGFVKLEDAVLGAAAGYLFLWGVYWLFRILTGKEGMGYGDFKLLAAIGAFFGWQSIPLVVLLSSVVGALVGIALMILAKRGRDIPIPFGPYLAAAGITVLFLGQKLNPFFPGMPL